MFNMMKDLAWKATGAISSTAASVGDFVTGEDAQVATDIPGLKAQGFTAVFR